MFSLRNMTNFVDASLPWHLQIISWCLVFSRVFLVYVCLFFWKSYLHNYDTTEMHISGCEQLEHQNQCKQSFVIVLIMVNDRLLFALSLSGTDFAL
jgi:hypothetical protein